MTIKLTKFRRLYRCDNCGTEGEWSEWWSWYGSYGLLESYPQDCPTLCSQTCAERFDAKMRAGMVEVPVVKLRGPNGVKRVGKRRGY